MARDDFDGATIYDSEGKEVGTVERTYNDGSAVRYVRIKIGALLARHRLVPVDDAEQMDDGFKVPYSKETIENGLDLSEDVNPLSGMVAEDLRGYYAGADARSTRAPSQRADGAAVPVTQETSSDRNETSSTLTDDQIPSVASTEDTVDGKDIGRVRDRGDVVEIPVVEERLVKQPVVTEVIRVRKTQSAEEQTASADLRREDLEVSSEGDVPVRDATEER